MNPYYEDLLRHIHGIGCKDLCQSVLGLPAAAVHETVVLSPGQDPERKVLLGEIEVLVDTSPLYGMRVWDVRLCDAQFTFIRTGCGAPAVLDAALALGMTGCKRILFLSSAGSIVKEIRPGDLVIPAWCVAGDGASRYLNGGMPDVFGERVYPDKAFSEQLRTSAVSICAESNISVHSGHVFCSDTLVGQYPHLAVFAKMGCNTLDMESAALFRAANMLGIPAAALLVVTDSTATGPSLLAGGDRAALARMQKTRKELVPEILKKGLTPNNPI